MGVAFAGLVSSLSSQANRTWTGAESSDWRTAGNWQEGAPANTTGETGNIAVFNGEVTGNQPNLPVGRSIRGLNFGSGGWVFTGELLSIGASGIGASGGGINAIGLTSGTVTFNNATIHLASLQEWVVGNGGTIDVFAALTGNGTLRIGSNSDALNRNGSIVFHTASARTTPTMIYSGQVKLVGNGTLGSGSLALNNSVGTLDISEINGSTYTIGGAFFTGRSTIHAAGKRVIVSGQLTPGITSTSGALQQNTTGLITISGAGSELQLGTETQMDLAGLSRGGIDASSYDAVDIEGKLIYAGNLTLNILNEVEGTFDLFAFDSYEGGFDSVGLTGTWGNLSLTKVADNWIGEAAGYQVLFSEAAGDLQIQTIPEPAVWAGLISGLLIVLSIRARRKQA